MIRRKQFNSPGGKLTVFKLYPGVFVVEVPETGRKISLGQPPDSVKRFQQCGYVGDNGITTFVVADSKLQDDSISWSLIEFPVLYALYYITAEVNGNRVPAFFAGHKPMIVGVERDVRQAQAVIKYGNYGVDSIEEFDAMDVPEATRDAMRREVLGLAVGNKVLDSDSFLESVFLEPEPKDETEFSDIGDGIRIGRIAYNTYRFLYGGDAIDVDVSLQKDEMFLSPVQYKHLKFPVMNFGVWHTGEHDGMDPYFSAAHTTLIHGYQPLLIDYPSNMTDVLRHHGLSKQSANTILLTHNHDDHIGALVELFRRSFPCRLVTTAPVQHSVVKKISALVDLPEAIVRDSFEWTILPFLKDDPFRTETLNLDGLHVTGHLSCHSVPTTVYTVCVNLDGYEYTYGHFLDMVAFKRMAKLVEDDWMPQAHLDYLEQVVRRTRYSLVKYDVGCTTEAALPFTVHGQWQDLIGAATDRQFRVFAHASKYVLDPAYEQEGRFVYVGDLDSGVRTPEGKLVRLGGDKSGITAFFMESRRTVLDYFESLLDADQFAARRNMVDYYATAFANCPKQPDANIGSFLYEQGEPSSNVIFIIRGRAQIIEHNENGDVYFRSVVGDGEVLGDLSVIANLPRTASVKSLNRLSTVVVPASLFREAMQALGVAYEGYFKDIFQRRLFFQLAPEISLDVSTTVFNRIAKLSRIEKVDKGQLIYKKGDKDGRLIVSPGEVELTVGKQSALVTGPTVVGECEIFLGPAGKPAPRLHSARATIPMEVLSITWDEVRHVPVIADNARRVIRARQRGIYGGLPQLNRALG